VRTWAPRGKTPVLQYGFNWKSLSVAAGLTAWNFYFRLYPGAIQSPPVVDFLNALVRAIRRPILPVWDRLPAHRSRMVQDHIVSLKGRIHQEYLPAYVPELNPVEYIWGYWKQHELPNLCPADYGQLSHAARGTPHSGPYAPSSPPDRRLLEAGFLMARITLYYAGVYKMIDDATGASVNMFHLNARGGHTLAN